MCVTVISGVIKRVMPGHDRASLFMNQYHFRELSKMVYNALECCFIYFKRIEFEEGESGKHQAKEGRY